MQMKLKKRALFLGLLLQLAVGFNAAGQITISPEVGVSYFPIEYGYNGSTGKRHFSEKTAFLIGVSGKIPIQEDWNINARISYTSRENLAWREWYGFIPWIMDYTYEHDDLNLDFSISRKLFNSLFAGIGPSIIRKINTTYSMNRTYEDGSDELMFNKNVDRFNYGINAYLGVEFKGVLLKLEYYRQLKDEYQNIFVGKNRYNAVIAYPIKIKNR